MTNAEPPIARCELHRETLGGGPGLPALCVAGLGADARSWSRVAPALGRGRRVWLPDNRGSGRSPAARAPLSTAGMADELRALLDERGAARAHVVGVSLGGLIAQELALSAPDRVQSLALVSTYAAPPAAAQAATRAGMQQLAALARAGGSHDGRVFALLLSLAHSPEFLRDERGLLREICAGAIPDFESFAAQVGAAMAHDARERLPGLRCPTLVIAGERDALVPPACGEALAALIPGARLLRLPGPHALPIEAPAALADALNTWFTRHDPPESP